MNNSKIIFLFVLVVTTSCNFDRSPVSSEKRINPLIIGDWYYRTTDSIVGQPKEFIYGIRIEGDGTAWKLAIVTATGKLAMVPNRKLGIFLEAFNNQFVYKNNPEGMELEITFTSKYKVSPNQLDLDMNTGVYKTYYRSQLGDSLTRPIKTEYELLMNGEKWENKKVSAAPSAFVNFAYSNLDTVLNIYSYSYHQSFGISLAYFSGVGEYILGIDSIFASYLSYGGCEIFGISSEQESSFGSVTVDTLDLIRGRCSGIFDFTIGTETFTNGKFSLPIYD